MIAIATEVVGPAGVDADEKDVSDFDGCVEKVNQGTYDDNNK